MFKLDIERNGKKVIFGQIVTLVWISVYRFKSESEYNSNNGAFSPLVAKLQEFYLELRRMPYPVSNLLFSGLVVFPVSPQAAPNPCALELCQQNKVLAHHHYFCLQKTFYSSVTPAWMFLVPAKGLMMINK